MTMRYRIVALLALALSLQYTHVVSGQEPDEIDGLQVELGEPWHTQFSDHTADEALLARDRWRRIDVEQYAGEAGEWAGHYLAPHGMTGGVRFAWAPTGGFVVAWVGCAPGVHETNYGAVTASVDRIRLAPERTASTRWRGSLAGELVFVRWGERRYLVPPEHVATFCRYAAGLEPDLALEEGLPFLFHADDVKKPAGGLPIVPKELARHVVAPVDAEVVAVLSSRPWPVASCEDCAPSVSLVTRVVIDAGAVDGIVEGTTLRIAGDGCFEEFVVRQVLRDSCEAEMVWPLDEDAAPNVVCDDGATRPEIAVGMRVTSRRER